MNKYAESVLYADDTSIIIANTNVHEYKHNIKLTMHWFAKNLLTVNYNKTSFLQFFTKKTKRSTIAISHSIFITDQ